MRSGSLHPIEATLEALRGDAEADDGRCTAGIAGAFTRCWRAVADDQTVATDATIVVEVQSESTARTDRREKLVVGGCLCGHRVGVTERLSGAAASG